jgi:ATP-dependent exoDNAse (exonuclease V) alpha subunit
MNIEINADFKEALNLISQTDDCVFISGNAGSGKTTFLRYYTGISKKKTVVLAPTGVAALNAGGETIHSFFKFKPNITAFKIKKKKLRNDSIYKKIETIIIDEASMLRCDLLDCIDRFLRLNRGALKTAFGGVQIVFIGDLRQLPPVVKREEKDIFNSLYSSPFFLSAKSLNECMLHTVELRKIYRQQDDNFIHLLNSVRTAKIGIEGINKLNSRVIKNSNFFSSPNKQFIYLTITNAKADKINYQYLSQIKDKEFEFIAETENISKEANAFPSQYKLVLKKGAQVMMLNNDSKGRWVNGSLGIVEDIKDAIDADRQIICVKFPNGRIESVEPYKWELFKYKWNEDLSQIETESAGFFKQYPLKLSWALTVHKSQGKTFENIIVDMEFGAFAPGQLYVALSRCPTLEGVNLVRPINRRDLLTSPINY